MKILQLNNLKLEQAMINLSCSDQLVVILRRLVTNNWVYMSPGFVSRDERRVGCR